VDTGVQAELVTPTGAAILTTLAASAGRMPSMTVSAVGYGAGTRDLPGAPNVLRCFIGDTAEVARGDETVLQVETTIDDMSPQLYEPLVERLFEAGARRRSPTPPRLSDPESISRLSRRSPCPRSSPSPDPSWPPAHGSIEGSPPPDSRRSDRRRACWRP